VTPWDWDALAASACNWLAGGDAPAGDVFATRVRLARNLAGRAFPRRAEPPERRAVLQEIFDKTQRVAALDGGYRFDLGSLEPVHRRLLGERHLASPELLESPDDRGVVVSADQRLSFMINEEDHVRLQALRPGLDLDGAARAAEALDRDLEGRLDFAWSETLGFLTACPTNVGTGMRVSILLHLPGVVLDKQIEALVESLRGAHLAIRGFYGEGSAALGNFFQVSNARTLGVREPELLDQLETAVQDLVGREQRAREALLSRARSLLEDKIWRSYGILTHARVLTAHEVLNHTSLLRLGASLGVLEIPAAALNDVLLHSQPAHAEMAARRAGESDVDAHRATIVREKLRRRDG
jgi:protein arginine kinase